MGRTGFGNEIAEFPQFLQFLFNGESDMDSQPEAKNLRAQVLISGRVQGVSFRWFTQRKAQALGLTGWVRNLWDGRVEAVFEGEEAAVRQAVAWCHTGEPPARVSQVEVAYQPATGEFRSFRITG
jgi:acylphosphatase